MIKLFVIDVDGTVANIQHRVPLIQGDPDKLRWREFFAEDLLWKDTPIEDAAPHFKDGEFVHGEHMFLTARIESTRTVTHDWLVQHGFATQKTLMLMKPDFMRKQRSKVFKPSVLKTLHVDRPDVEIVLIEDYGEVRRAVDELGFVKTRKAPKCWKFWSLSWGY